MKPKTISVLLASLLLATVANAQDHRGWRSSWADPVEQWATTVKFSHKFHQEEVGAECTQCHAAVDTSVSSSDLLLPKQEACSDCHDVETESECKLCHVNENRREAFQTPARAVLFNHKFHLEQQELECTTCHASVEQSEKPSVANLPTMADCNTCHNNVKASQACERCHAEVELLLPITHREVNWFKEHKRQVRAGDTTNDCAVCHSDNFCQRCHAGVTTQITRGDRTRSVPENRPAPSGSRDLVKQRVHNLNFVFTHGIDLRSRQSDCNKHPIFYIGGPADNLHGLPADIHPI